MRRFATHALLPGITCAIGAGLLYGFQVLTGISVSSREVDLDSQVDFAWGTLTLYLGIGLVVGVLPEIAFGRRGPKKGAEGRVRE